MVKELRQRRRNEAELNGHERGDFIRRHLSKRYLIPPSLLCATFCAPAAEFYAAPSGLPSGTGAIASPWSLESALGQPNNVVKPGDTIWLRGGSYTGATNVWINNLNGTAAAPILVRQYPGERATVNY